MKAVYILSAAMLLGAGSMSAQGKIDAHGRQLLDLYHAGRLDLVPSQAFLTAPASRSAAAMVDVLVETKDTAVLDSLESCGYTVEYISPSFSIVNMPVDGIETLAESPTVETLSFGHQSETAMDEARSTASVNAVHSGLGIEYNGDKRHPFKGKGVIVGMFDTGFDPSHINFLDASGKNCRIKFYARFSGSSTSATVYTDDKVRTAPTDSKDETHGTHVAGIMGGAYNGSGTYYVKNGSIAENKGTLPLYGVAPEADLAICAGPLYNNSILAGIRRIINYAQSERKPAVINLSLGGNEGPHDGTDAFSRSLDELGREAIICVAAGNEGGDNIHTGKTFTATDKQLRTLIQGNRMRASKIDVWSSTPDEIKVSLVLYNSVSGEVVAKITGVDGKTVTCGSGEGNDHSIFRNAFNGSPVITAVRNGNRYNVSITSNSDVTPKSGTSEVLGIMIEGNEGVRVDAYGNRNLSFAVSQPAGFDAGNNDGSINSMGCGFNTIVVGAYGTRSQYFDINGQQRSTGGGAGNLASYSSWGNLVDGRKMPHITAPGTGIISSYSGYYVTPNYSSITYMLCATAKEGETTHYWGSMNGTSMATPYVTGAVGLWLEADPTLKVDEVRQIMMETATKDGSVTDATAWGAGKINAAKGIKEVIKRKDGVEDVIAEESPVMITTNGRTIEAFVGGMSGVQARLYSISGALAAGVNASGDTAVLEAPAAGVYVLVVKAGATTKTEKLMIQ